MYNTVSKIVQNTQILVIKFPIQTNSLKRSLFEQINSSWNAKSMRHRKKIIS